MALRCTILTFFTRLFAIAGELDSCAVEHRLVVCILHQEASIFVLVVAVARLIVFRFAFFASIKVRPGCFFIVICIICVSLPFRPGISILSSIVFSSLAPTSTALVAPFLAEDRWCAFPLAVVTALTFTIVPVTSTTPFTTLLPHESALFVHIVLAVIVVIAVVRGVARHHGSLVTAIVGRRIELVREETLLFAV